MANKNVMDANRRLAGLLGWTNIIDVGNALLGTPTWVCDNSRGQVQVPNWAGDWRDCGPLTAQYRMSIGYTESDAVATCAGYERGAGFARLADHETVDAAMMLAVVSAVCKKLEAAR